MPKDSVKAAAAAAVLLTLVVASQIHVNNGMKLINMQQNYRSSFRQDLDDPTLISLLDDKTVRSFHNHPCRRECQPGESLTCYYVLIVHDQQTQGPECQECLDDPSNCKSDDCHYADGVRNSWMMVNNQLPGPAIEVCENDTIVAEVVNLLDGEPTTMHWHGLQMSRTQNMDGAPFITQYPIERRQGQRYTFPADRSGTVWYHSHVGWQRAQGVAGALIIRQPKLSNPHVELYDYDLIEHTLLIQDVIYNATFNKPRNIVINGKGRNHLNSWRDNDQRHNYERITVSQGKRYRLRFINNGVFNCPVEVSIGNHKMLVISSDGGDVEPMPADIFYMTSGERIDIVLHANQSVGNYWLRVKGLEQCATFNIYQAAVLHYRGAPKRRLPRGQIMQTVPEKADNLPVSRVNILTEARNLGARTTQAHLDEVPTLAMKSLQPLPWTADTNFITYYKSFGMPTINGRRYSQADDITFVLPQESLLQASQQLDNNGNLIYNREYCNQDKFIKDGINCRETLCECTNVETMPAYSPIELVVVNLSNSTHPFHMHGYTFRVVGQQVWGDAEELRNIKLLDKLGLLQRIPSDFTAAEKDTVQMPPLGYIIIRFMSNNPGYWLYHCHIEGHALNGMAGVIHIQ